jgi:hypothetical protein
MVLGWGTKGPRERINEVVQLFEYTKLIDDVGFIILPGQFNDTVFRNWRRIAWKRLHEQWFLLLEDETTKSPPWWVYMRKSFLVKKNPILVRTVANPVVNVLTSTRKGFMKLEASMMSGRIVWEAQYQPHESLYAIEAIRAIKKKMIAKDLASENSFVRVMFDGQPLRGNVLLKPATRSRKHKRSYRRRPPSDQHTIHRYFRRLW